MELNPNNLLIPSRIPTRASCACERMPLDEAEMKPVAVTAIALSAVAIAGAALFGLTLARPSAADASSAGHLVEDAVSAHPNALWHIVHDLCVTDQKASGQPAPCVSVNLDGGYAVLKDIQGPTQYLVIPTARVTGIESPDLLADASPNYWQAAWAVRPVFEQKVGHPVPREDLSLAVNSVDGRTQNQLHIHVDCVRANVAETLKLHIRQIGPRWSKLALGAAGHNYNVRWLDGAELGPRDPFKILARTDPVARADMGRETLVLVGAKRPNGAPGFVLLSDRSNGSWTDRGAGEELQDHSCKILDDAAPAGATS
jgi:CDP-diacylglycerol pyrophosphatase